LTKVRRVETEEEKDDDQLKQALDKAAVLQEELIEAADRESQLQMQLDDLTQLSKWLEQRSDLQKDFDSFVREQEMKQCESRFISLK